MNGSTLVVIGTSAGGFHALPKLVAQLPGDFDAPVLVVQHRAPDSDGEALLSAMNRAGRLVCKHGEDGEPMRAGTVYVAPADHHMLVGDGGLVRITKGAAENRSRPAVDPLFRSAAVAYGRKVVGVVLTGYLDDGTAGMAAIKRCGGVGVVQDPDDADYPDMPRSVLDSGVEVDHRVPLAEMGALLSNLLHRRLPDPAPIPEDIAIEARIAARVLSDLGAVEAIGSQVPFNCPGCGGVLWEVEGSGLHRFRCHTGHAYSASVLLAEQSARVEETLWVALRMFEERKNLLTRMAAKDTGAAARSAAERARASQVHIERIRAMLRSSDPPADEGPG